MPPIDAAPAGFEFPVSTADRQPYAQVTEVGRRRLSRPKGAFASIHRWDTGALTRVMLWGRSDDSVQSVRSLASRRMLVAANRSFPNRSTCVRSPRLPIILLGNAKQGCRTLLRSLPARATEHRPCAGGRGAASDGQSACTCGTSRQLTDAEAKSSPVCCTVALWRHCRASLICL